MDNSSAQIKKILITGGNSRFGVELKKNFMVPIYFIRIRKN